MILVVTIAILGPGGYIQMIYSLDAGAETSLLEIQGLKSCELQKK